MEINQHYHKTEKTARYATYGNLSEHTKYFWMALHGSNMVCEQMLYKFSDFNPDEHFVIAPEGLNRFYTNGFGGDVQAAWMTSRDRLEEINDFSNYLSDLYQKYIGKLPSSCAKIILGFSQGGTTAFRWLHNSQIKVDFLISYSCWIPEDINLAESSTNLNKTNMIYTWGLQDEFLTEKGIYSIQEIIDKNKLKINMESYAGIHRIEKSQLKFLYEKYILKQN